MRHATRLPVVLLHGSAAGPSQWTGLAAQLPRGHERRMPSLPGYGAAADMATGGRLADEAYAVARQSVRAGDRVHLVGHSYGGAVALKIAMAWPERIASLTLIEPALFHLLRDGGNLERQMYADIADIEVRLRKAVANGDAESGVASFIDFWCGRACFTALAPEKRQALVGEASRIVGNFTSIARENWLLDELSMVKAPVLALTGTQSPVLIQHLTRLIAGAIADARVIAMSEAGHMLPFTHAAATAHVLAHHFAEAEAAMRALPRAA